MSMKKACIIAALIFAPSFGLAFAKEEQPKLVSLIDLIANGERYEGVLVQVGGYISLADEEDALYLSKSDYAAQFGQNGIWIDISERDEKRLRPFSRRYGYLIGRFSAKRCGHMCLYHGSLKFLRLGVTYDEVRN